MERLILKVRVEVAREFRTTVNSLEHCSDNDPGHLMVLLILHYFFKAPIYHIRGCIRKTSAPALAEKLHSAKILQTSDTDFATQYVRICEALESVAPEILPSWMDSLRFRKQGNLTDAQPILMIRNERTIAFQSSRQFVRDSDERS